MSKPRSLPLITNELSLRIYYHNISRDKRGAEVMSRRKVEIKMKHATYEELEKIYRETNDVRLKIRYLAMLKFMEGYTSIKVAELLNTSDSTVREWLNRYNVFGVEGLISRKPKGAECKLTDEQLKEVYVVLQKSPREYGFNKSNWTMSVLKIWIREKFRVGYAVSSLYDLVHRIGFTIQRPKKQSKNADPQKQVEFRKELEEIIDKADENTVILYEDEAIITTEPSTKSAWAPKGKQPVVVTNSSGSRQRRVIFGACNPKNGDIFYATEESGNSENFEDFLK